MQAVKRKISVTGTSLGVTTVKVVVRMLFTKPCLIRNVFIAICCNTVASHTAVRTMSVLLIAWLKCMLAASRAAPW